MILVSRASLALVIAAALFTAPSHGYAQDGAAQYFNANDVFDLEYAADPQIAPDGQQIVYTRRSNDVMTDSTRSNLWIINADGSEHRPLVSGRDGAASARWSPDGSRIAYISGAEGSPQLYVRWMDTGQTALVTNLTRSPSGITWSPDGKTIAFTMSIKGESKSMVKPRAKPEGANWAPSMNLIESLIYRRDGRGYIETAYTHVFTVPADGGTPRQLTSGNFNHSGPLSWSHDGSEILFAANRHDDWEYETIEGDIFAVSTKDGSLRQITDAPGREYDPVVSPDGTKIGYLTADNKALAYRNSYVHVMDYDGTNSRSLSGGFDRSAGDLNWAGDGSGLYFLYTNRGLNEVGFVTLSGSVTKVAGDIGGNSLGRPYTSGSYSVAKSGAIALTSGTATRPSDLSINTGNGNVQLTQLNEDLLAGRALGQVHEIIYKSSHDGQEIQGWYMTPPDFDPAKKYPLILEIHGGPHAAYGPNFSAEMQLMAAAGYVVFYDNHRGSTGYGEDFALLLQYKYSSADDLADHTSGVDAMIDMGFIDEKNTFITGGSAGGIATAFAVGMTNRFNAAVAAKPIVNWISKTLTGDIYTYQIRHQFPGMPWDEFEHYWARSPLSLVGNVTTPTMLMTGEEDFRTPISESEQFYQALKLRKIDTALVRVPGSPHGIAGRPSRLNSKVDYILAWFDRYKAE